MVTDQDTIEGSDRKGNDRRMSLDTVNRCRRNLWRSVVPTVLTGVLMAVAFPGFDQWYLAWVGLVPLLLVLDRASPRQGFWRGYLAGTVYFGIVLSWMCGLVHWVGIIVLPGIVALVAYLALYWAMFGWAYCRLRGVWVWAPVLVGPFVWTVLEYLQSRLFTGFGWGLIGHTQISDLPLAQCAALGGVFLVSAIVIAVNLCLAATILRRPHRWIALVAAGAVLILSHALGYTLMSGLPPVQGEMDVGVVQGNISIEVNYDARYDGDVMFLQENISRTLVEDMREHGASTEPEAPLVVWPESALPGYEIQPDSDYGLRAALFAEEQGAYLLAGGVRREHDGSGRVYNTAFMFDPEGRLVDTYDKVHLTPYGEYVPLGKLMPFLGKVVLQMVDITAGSEMKVFRAGDAQFGPLICFETIFPELSRQLVDRGAQFIVVVSNLAWFGQGAARDQEFAISRFRAIENHVPLVRAANTGISGIVQPDGRLMNVMHAGVIGGNRGGTFARVRLTDLGSLGTFYTRHGDVFVLLSAAVLATTFAVSIAASKKK